MCSYWHLKKQFFRDWNNISISKLPIFFWFFTGTLTPLLPLRCWAAHNTDLPSDRNIPETLRINTVFSPVPFKEYSRSFLMVLRLIDFALVVLKLLMFKSCVITGISKIQVFKFSGTERVKQNQKKLKTIQNLLSLSVNHFSSNFNKIPIFFLVFHWNFNPFAPCTLLWR